MVRSWISNQNLGSPCVKIMNLVFVADCIDSLCRFHINALFLFFTAKLGKKQFLCDFVFVAIFIYLTL